MSPLTFSRNQHLRLALLLPVCLGFGALAACSQTQQAPEQPENRTKPEVVRIDIIQNEIRIVGRGGGQNNSSKRPRRVCYDASNNCLGQIEYIFLSPQNNPGITLSIEYKDGVYWEIGSSAPTTISPEECFAGFTGNGVLTLTEDDPKKSITLKEDVDECGKEKTFFFYDVKCKETTPGSGACADIKDLDPGTLLDNGRR